MMLLNNILGRKAYWIGHILIINCLLHDVIKIQMTEVKWAGRRTKTELLDDLRNRRRYWELKDGTEEQKGGSDSLPHEHKE